MREFLRTFAAQGRTVIVSSHILAEVAQTVDRVVIINRGRLVLHAPLSELTDRVSGTVTVQAARLDALERALRAAGVVAIEPGNGTLRVHGLSAERVGEIAAQANVTLGQLVTETSSLEKVFLELTGEGQR